MLVGTRDARWPRAEEGFTRQWSDPRVAPELRALGFEKPEQLGATFIGDAPHLRQMTRDVLPLTDGFPKRLNDASGPGTLSSDYLAWMNTDATRERFRTSEFVRRAWPEELRKRTLSYFRFQRMIDESRGFSRGPVHRGDRVRNIHIAITEGGLHTLPLWWLGVEENQLRAMDRHLANGGSEDRHPYRLGARALADGDFDRAAAFFGRVRLSSYDQKLLWFLRLYSLCMAGRVDDAEMLARDRLASTQLDRKDRAFFDWLTATFGFTPLEPR
jgi:hypothetical protein